MLFFRQLWVLIWKNLLVAFVRRPFTTTARALVLPVVFSWFLSYAKNFFVPYAVYGIGSASPVLSLSEALSKQNTRNTLVFNRNGFLDGDIQRVIDNVSAPAVQGGYKVQVIDNDDDILSICRSDLNGNSNCFAAIEFTSSPSEGTGGLWNYTFRADGGLGEHILVNQNNNDQEIFILPLQHAVDFAIAGLNTTIDHSALPATVEQYPFTSQNTTQRNTSIRIRYMQALISVLGVGFFIGICGITYQQVGAQAVEREIKMAQLLEVMMPNRKRWQPQVARLLSYHFAFTLIYFPGWLIMAGILKAGVFQRTNAGIIIVLHFLTGLSLASSALFMGAFFRKAQLSGITAILINLVLAILAQVYPHWHTSQVIGLSLFFPSMTYTYFVLLMAYYEQQNIGTSLVGSPPYISWHVSGIVFFVFLIIQIFMYPLLAIVVERVLWGTTSGNRRLETSGTGAAVEVNNFRKVFKVNWFAKLARKIFRLKPRKDVVAVDDLTFSVLPGQICVLLGANGSGKSTTLDSIAGLSQLSSGSISVDFSHGLGFCPQGNVLWKDLTVYEHVDIFNRLKSVDTLASKEEKIELIRGCDLMLKIRSKAGTLSGGQMRKLQMSMMFTGGSKICLIDEVSSGIDALARRKVQDILLAERSASQRSMIFTTHFLDEAETVADQILIMSKGRLRVSGTAPQIKSSGLYRVHLQHTPGCPSPPDYKGVKRIDAADQTIYEIENAATTAEVLEQLETTGAWKEYHVSGPTLEDVFLKVAEEMNASTATDDSESDKASLEKPEPRKLMLQDGSPISPFKQGLYLFHKRLTVFRRNPLPNLVAMLIPIVAAGLVSLFLKGYTAAGCTPQEQVSESEVYNLTEQLYYKLDIVLGPSSRFSAESLALIEATQPTSFIFNASSTGPTPMSTNVTSYLHFVDTLPEFNDYITTYFHNVTPGGFFLGDGSSAPTFAYVANKGMPQALLTQNIFDILTTNISIATQYEYFDIPWQADQGNTLQFCIYLGLVLSIAPAFFGLYPCVERVRNVRSMHYSNGVRALALWQAYLGFDMLFMLVAAVISVIIFAAAFSGFFALGLLFVVIFFYFVVGILMSYIISLFAKSQLATFAVAAAYGAVAFLLYIIGYIVTITYAPVDSIETIESYVYFFLALILPPASLTRSLFISVNVLNINCRGTDDYVSNPAEMLAYGGPITYLIVQSFVLFAFLVWWDSGVRFGQLFRRKTYREEDAEEKALLDADVAAEVIRVEEDTDDGLRVLHASKSFGSNKAVDDLSFGVKPSEVFCLLGPNGAGKSTTVSMIRGDLKPSNNGGDILISGLSLLRKRNAARQHLGVCPQFDAMDQLTVLEHLRFYARIRGVKNVEENVQEVVRAVGLAAFKERMGISLSGGNKRKLSLGIALMGNPDVMLLDEPSSGMDVAAKRTMWKTLAAVVPGRSIVLTTHSMEEADVLATRAGIMAKRFLALGTTQGLRRRHGDRYYVHMVLKSAPYSTDAEVEKVLSWIRANFEGAETERAFHGQIRFSVPAGLNSPRSPTIPSKNGVMTSTSPIFISERNSSTSSPSPSFEKSSPETAITVRDIPSSPLPAQRTLISSVFTTLEQAKLKGDLGFEYYTVSQTTLDQVFLDIVRKHDVQEENYRVEVKEREEKSVKWWMLWRRGVHNRI